MKYTRGDTVVGFEKLWFLQKRHASRYASTQAESPYSQNSSHSLVELAVKPILALLDQPSTSSEYSFYRTITRPEDRENVVQHLVFADAQNYTNPAEFIQRNIYFFTPPSLEALTSTIPVFKLRHIPSAFSEIPSVSTISGICQTLLKIPDHLWDGVTISSYVKKMIYMGCEMTLENTEVGVGTSEEMEALKLKVEKSWSGLIYRYLRWALVAVEPGPESQIMMELLGKKETSRRLLAAEEVLKRVESDHMVGEIGKV